MPVDTILWDQNKLKIIDQTLLPEKYIIIDLDTEDPRLEKFLIYLENYEKENKDCFKKVDPDKMDYIAKLIQVDY